MTATTPPRRSRWVGWALIVLLVAVIVTFVAIGVAGATGRPTAAGTSSAPAASTSTSSAPAASASPTEATPAATAKATSTPAKTSAPTVVSTPQPTKVTEITKVAPIKKSLTATVTRMTAVKGQANGPGEIAGPAVQFAITITNNTGKSFDLANTVVNAYYGKAASPAIELDGPGGATFPTSVANGKSASGVFVYNIPTSQRGTVQVTVDTSVANPVVAFTGSAPR